MDGIALSLKMKRLTAWLDTQNQPDGLAGRRFHGVPFGDVYVTIDPEHQAPYASANLYRVHLCGTGPGMSAIVAVTVHRQGGFKRRGARLAPRECAGISH